MVAVKLGSDAAGEIASGDATARLWDATTGQQIAALLGHEDGLTSACFSRDGARILTASYDRTARRWDGTTGKEITALRRHEDGVTGACFFSPDGARIVTTSSDRTTRLWDAATSQQIVRIALDAAVTMVSVHAGMIALNDRLGRFHVFEAETFLSAKDSVSG